jgi:hypothetical protein
MRLTPSGGIVGHAIAKWQVFTGKKEGIRRIIEFLAAFFFDFRCFRDR